MFYCCTYETQRVFPLILITRNWYWQFNQQNGQTSETNLIHLTSHSLTSREIQSAIWHSPSYSWAISGLHWFHMSITHGLPQHNKTFLKAWAKGRQILPSEGNVFIVSFCPSVILATVSRVPYDHFLWYTGPHCTGSFQSYPGPSPLTWDPLPLVSSKLRMSLIFTDFPTGSGS